MRIRTFYEIYRKKPTTEKVDLLVEQVELMMRNEARHSEAIDRGNRDDADYYYNEFRGIRERARWLRWAIKTEIKEGKANAQICI